MRKLLFIFVLFLSISLYSQEQEPKAIDSIGNVMEMKQVPILENDGEIIQENVTDDNKPKETIGKKVGKFFGFGKDKEKDKKIEELTKKINSQSVLIDSMAVALTKPKIIIKEVPKLSPASSASIKKDEKFINNLPKTYGNLQKKEVSKLTKQIDEKIAQLIKQRDSIVRSGGDSDMIDAKNNLIQSLRREKSVINLTQESTNLKDENTSLTDLNADLKVKENKLKKYLYSVLSVLFVLILVIAVILQRKKINIQDGEIESQLSDINKKNNYLEHAARIIRHDMHSGINTYIPRGLNSLQKRISEETAKELKIDGSIKMIKEGLSHTQKVYKSVYEFTNLVKSDVILETKSADLKIILSDYINTTAYVKQVEISDLITANVNDSLFCTAIDNLIRNGLNHNDSPKKLVRVYMEDTTLVIEDNGRGLSPSKFEKIRKNRERGGLGLSIALAIIEEHGFQLDCENINPGTKMKIKLK
jgi:signal transduction histidine kinase